MSRVNFIIQSGVSENVIIQREMYNLLANYALKKKYE